MNDMKEILVDIHGPNSGETALRYASKYGDLPIVKALKMVDLNSRNEFGENALHLAARYKKHEIVEYLAKQAEMDINAKTIYQHTALHMATFNRDFQSVQVLLKYGADPYLKDNWNRSSFDLALARGNFMDFYIAKASNEE